MKFSPGLNKYISFGIIQVFYIKYNMAIDDFTTNLWVFLTFYDRNLCVYANLSQSFAQSLVIVLVKLVLIQLYRFSIGKKVHNYTGFLPEGP